MPNHSQGNAAPCTPALLGAKARETVERPNFMSSFAEKSQLVPRPTPPCSKKKAPADAAESPPAARWQCSAQRKPQLLTQMQAVLTTVRNDIIIDNDVSSSSSIYRGVWHQCGYAVPWAAWGASAMIFVGPVSLARLTCCAPAACLSFDEGIAALHTRRRLAAR